MRVISIQLKIAVGIDTVADICSVFRLIKRHVYMPNGNEMKYESEFEDVDIDCFVFLIKDQFVA